MKNFDKITLYLRRELSEKEALLFEQEIASNKELALEVSIQRFEEETINLGREDDLRNRIQAIQKESDQEVITPKRTVTSLRKWILPISVAASFMLVISYFYFQNQYSNANLVAQYYDYSISNLRKGTPTESDLVEEKELFTQGNYMDAIQRLEILVEDSVVNLQATYLLGHCYFKISDFEKSRICFGQLKDLGIKAGPYLQNAQWFWALSKLALDQLDDEFSNVLSSLVQKKYPKARDLEKRFNSKPSK